MVRRSLENSAPHSPDDNGDHTSDENEEADPEDIADDCASIAFALLAREPGIAAAKLVSPCGMCGWWTVLPMLELLGVGAVLFVQVDGHREALPERWVTDACHGRVSKISILWLYIVDCSVGLAVKREMSVFVFGRRRIKLRRNSKAFHTR